MIKTATTFTTNNKQLQAIYDNAERILLSSVKSFGDRRVLTLSPSTDKMTLHSEILGALTLSARDTEAALNTVRAALYTVRADGRPADSLSFENGNLVARHGKLTGLCFAEEALSLYYLTRKKDNEYLDLLLDVLERFDDYLWTHHDLNFDKSLELFDASETEEGHASGRYETVKVLYYGENKEVSPFPVESADLMACDVAIRRVIARIYSLKNDTERAREWNLKAIDVQTRIKASMWADSVGACFDSNYRGRAIDVLTVNNLFMMYYGAFDRNMARRFVERCLMNPDLFYTPFPFPGVPLTDARAIHKICQAHNGLCRGLTYRRAIGALEKYGYFSLLTDVGLRFLNAVENGAFTELFDPLTGAPISHEGGCEYTPAATAALEYLARFFGVCQELDHLHWGALGLPEGQTSEFCFHMGGDVLRLTAEEKTSSGFIGESHLFTVTNGMRIITDLHGNGARAVNVTDHPIDGVLVYRDRTYSFSLPPDGVFDSTEADKRENVNKKKKFASAN